MISYLMSRCKKDGISAGEAFLMYRSNPHAMCQAPCYLMLHQFEHIARHFSSDPHLAGFSFCRDEAARRADDATHRAADRANQGVDKVRETRRDLHRDADSPREVREKGADAVDSAKDAAVQTKSAACLPLSCCLLALSSVSCGIFTS